MFLAPSLSKQRKQLTMGFSFGRLKAPLRSPMKAGVGGVRWVRAALVNPVIQGSLWE